MNCKTGKFGYNISRCENCDYIDLHANSCRNRNCPNCQAVLKEIWIDKRKSEVIDASYFHVIFTVPAQLNPLFYANQKLLYSLFHRCCSETLLELSKNPRYLGATPGIIQVLHTWGQELNYHPHVHCIVSGGGLTDAKKRKLCKDGFFLPILPLMKKFRGKFLALLDQYHKEGKLSFSGPCSRLRNRYAWSAFKDQMYRTEWNIELRETFNGKGNAIEYLGRYTNRIAITNARILRITPGQVTFLAKDYRTGETNEITISCEEFIRRFMMHVLPAGFQKIRYSGFLNNRWKKKNLTILFNIQGHQRFREMLAGLPMDELLQTVWGYDIHICPVCKCSSMRHAGRIYARRN